MIRCGYVRVSRDDQSAENQIQLLVKEGIDPENIFTDHITGISQANDRPGFSDLLTFLSGIPDDVEVTLYIFEISRLGRSFLETLSTVKHLEESGVRVWSLSPAESWSRIEDRKLRDLMLSIFSWVADRERENLIERTKLGLARAKAEGKRMGRPEREIPKKKIEELRAKGLSLAAISRVIDVPYSTLRRKFEKSPT